MNSPAQPDLTPADRLARLKQVASHLMDRWPGVLKRRIYMQRLGQDETLREAFTLSYAAHVHNALQDVLLSDLIVQITALVLDRTRGSASVSRARSSLRDHAVIEELRAEYMIVPPAPPDREDEELDEATRAEVNRVICESELKRSLSDFDWLLGRLEWIDSEVLGSEVGNRIATARNKAIAHYDIEREGTDWRLWRIGGIGLTYGQLYAYINVCTEAIDTLNKLVRRASFAFDEVEPIGRQCVDEYIDALVIGLRTHHRAEEERRKELKAQRSRTAGENPSA